MSQVIIILGSDSDLEMLQSSQLLDFLKGVGVDYEVSVISAHRNPDKLKEYVTSKTFTDSPPVFIAAAGMAAVLPGAVASHARYNPVIGVALASPEFPNAEDAMLSIARMPKGVPVAFAGIGKTGFVNAAILACQIFAVTNLQIRDRLYDCLARLDKPAQIAIDPNKPQPNL